LYAKQLEEEEDSEQAKAQLEAQLRERFSKPYNVAASGHVDEILIPAETRSHLIAALELLRDKKVQVRQKKHGNIPL
jgi:propionyl-CoA carboxylase beta chain